MKRHLASLLAASLLASSTALAQVDAPPPPPPLEDAGGGGGAWSVYSGRTLKTGNVFAAEAGWPGVNASFYHGAGGFDIGGRFTFNYGTEIAFAINPAMNLHLLMRFGLLDRGMFTMALQIEPGVGFYFTDGGGMIIHMPVGLQMGIHPIRVLAILVGVELRPQIIIAFPGGVDFAMPMLFVNPGVEYALTDSVALTFRMAFGPGIVAAGGFAKVDFSFRALMGVSIKL